MEIIKPVSDKVLRGQAGLKTAVWNESKSWHGPLREYARLSGAVRNLIQEPNGETISNLDAHAAGASAIESTLDPVAALAEKRLRFFTWEVDALIARLQPEFSSAIGLLTHIFFRELGYRVKANDSHRAPEVNDLLFDTVIKRRTPSGLVGSLLFAWIGERVCAKYLQASDFLGVELVVTAPMTVVRIVPSPGDQVALNTPQLLNLASCGLAPEFIHQEEWSNWCDTPATLSRVGWTEGLIRLISDLSRGLAANISSDYTTASARAALSAQLLLLDQLIALEPSETRRWAERALVNFYRGSRNQSLDDLKRYFAFHGQETAPLRLVELYRNLTVGPKA